MGRRGTGERDREGPAENSELADKKFFTPPILKLKSVFRDWTEEFVEYLEEKDAILSEQLKLAADNIETITSLGDTETMVKRGKKLYLLLKRCIDEECKEARATVRDVEGGNVWEAWRLLGARFDPRNDLSNAATMDIINNKNIWKCNSVLEFPQKVSKWERLQR